MNNESLWWIWHHPCPSLVGKPTRKSVEERAVCWAFEGRGALATAVGETRDRGAGTEYVLQQRDHARLLPFLCSQSAPLTRYGCLEAYSRSRNGRQARYTVFKNFISILERAESASVKNILLTGMSSSDISFDIVSCIEPRSLFWESWFVRFQMNRLCSCLTIHVIILSTEACR